MKHYLVYGWNIEARTRRRRLRSTEVYHETEKTRENTDEIKVPVLYNIRIPFSEMLDDTELLEIIDSEEKRQFNEGESDWNPGVWARFSGEIVAPFSKMTVLRQSETTLVHVAEIEHGLCVVPLRIGRQAVLSRSRLVVNTGSSPVVVGIAEFYLFQVQTK